MRVFVIAFIGCMSCLSSAFADDSPSARGMKIFDAWRSQFVDVHSVHVQFDVFLYDYSFGVAQYGSGEFFLRDDKTGFMTFQPRVTRGIVLGPRGKHYRIEAWKPQSWIWTPTDTILIDHEREEVVVNRHDEDYIRRTHPRFHFPPVPPMPQPISQVQRSTRNWDTFFAWLFAGFDDSLSQAGNSWNSMFLPENVMPITPGCLFKNALDEVTVAVDTEEENEYRLSFKPVQLSENFREIQFILKDKNHPRLSAVRYIHPGDTAETVYVFSDVKINPIAIPQPPDYSRYLKRNPSNGNQ